MRTFQVGEEVLYDGRRYVISALHPDEPYHYRLLATTPDGARMVWANAESLKRIESYTKARADTERY